MPFQIHLAVLVIFSGTLFGARSYKPVRPPTEHTKSFFSHSMRPVSLSDTQTRSHHPAQRSGIEIMETARMQLTIPGNWQTANLSNGDVVVFVEKGGITVTFIVSAEIDKTVSGLKKGLNEKLTAMTARPASSGVSKDGSIKYRRETGTGNLHNVPIEWSITVYGTPQVPVVALKFGLAKFTQRHANSIAVLLNDVKAL